MQPDRMRIAANSSQLAEMDYLYRFAAAVSAPLVGEHDRALARSVRGQRRTRKREAASEKNHPSPSPPSFALRGNGATGLPWRSDTPSLPLMGRESRSAALKERKAR